MRKVIESDECDIYILDIIYHYPWLYIAGYNPGSNYALSFCRACPSSFSLLISAPQQLFVKFLSNLYGKFLGLSPRLFIFIKISSWDFVVINMGYYGNFLSLIFSKYDAFVSILCGISFNCCKCFLGKYR